MAAINLIIEVKTCSPIFLLLRNLLSLKAYKPCTLKSDKEHRFFEMMAIIHLMLQSTFW